MRIQKSATIQLSAPLSEVFPLFGPIREKDWAYGWNPEVIYPSNTLVAEQMVFQTQGGLHGSSEPYTWVVVNYKPADHWIEYMVSASERLWFIRVTCTAEDNQTSATVTYSYTGLTADGDRKNAASLNSIFSSDLRDWETAINHYLKTGTRLKS